MELLEYQAKKLFKTVDIPVLPSQTIRDPRKIKQLQIPYPVVLKSQVSSGGRGKAGGIRFVANTIDAIAAARTIFNLSILGEYPEVILAEAHYNTERELFLAIVLDYDRCCPVLLGSAFGGMNVNSLLANLQQVVVDSDFSLFYARRLAARMGLSGKLICSVADIIAKMYLLFNQTDLDLIEINPLGVNAGGELMALDGKITVSDHALARQSILETLSFSQHQQKVNHHSLLAKNINFSQINWRWLDWHDPSGQIAMICNSFDSALLTWDLLKQSQVIPACAILLENSLTVETQDLPLYRQKLSEILTQLENIKGVKVILLNIWEPDIINREILQTVGDYHAARVALSSSESMPANDSVVKTEESKDTSENLKSTSSSQPSFVLRLLDKDNINLEELEISETIHLFGNLEAAIKKAIAIVKSN
jgi:succinyl-CoA synthetase beta subunit